MAKTGTKITLTTLCLGAMAIVVLATVTLFQPLSLPFLPAYSQKLISQQHYANEIHLDDVALKWRPLDDAIEIHFQNIRAIDFDAEVIGSIPKVVLGLAISSIFQGDLKIKYIDLIRPRVSFYRTAGGAVKFDIGTTDEGVSGKILEYLLIDIAAAKGTMTDSRSFPRISMRDAKIMIGDEVSGALLKIPKANIQLDPDPSGVRGLLDLELFSGGERLHAVANSIFRTSDQMIDMSVELDRVRPAILAEMLPQLRFLAPVEVPLSGRLDLVLDKFLAISKASFDLTGQSGTLEIAQFVGLNLSVVEIRIRGGTSHNLSRFELENLWADFGGAKIEARGIFVKETENLRISTEVTAFEVPFTELMPRVFAQLESSVFSEAETLYKAPESTTIVFDGRYHLPSQTLSGEAMLSYRDSARLGNLAEVDGAASPLNHKKWRLKVQGPLRTPNMVVIPVVAGP